MPMMLDALWGAGGMASLFVAITGGGVTIADVQLPPIGLGQRILFAVLGVGLIVLALVVQRRSQKPGPPSR